MSAKTGENWEALWDFANPVRLNHGSFGATPRKILDFLEQETRIFDRDREAFILDGGWAQVDAARGPLAAFVGAKVEDLVFIDNATEAFNTVIRSLKLGSDDEVVVTDHIYPPFVRPLHELAARQGFTIVTAKIPFPVSSDDEILNPLLAAVTAQTRLVIVDHISSPTALIFPVEKIVAALSVKGVDCFVDGAHAPGQIPVDLDNLGAAYYTANNHKWLCAPVSSGFLHVRGDRQKNISPVVASGANEHPELFVGRFYWQGTKNILPRLVVPETLTYMACLHPQGWEGIRRRNHELAVKARDLLCKTLGIGKPCPDNMIGCMFSLPLPPLKYDAETEAKPVTRRLGWQLQKRHGFHAYTALLGEMVVLRVSCHLYNDMSHYERLAAGLSDILKEFRVT